MPNYLCFTWPKTKKTCLRWPTRPPQYTNWKKQMKNIVVEWGDDFNFFCIQWRILWPRKCKEGWWTRNTGKVCGLAAALSSLQFVERDRIRKRKLWCSSVLSFKFLRISKDCSHWQRKKIVKNREGEEIKVAAEEVFEVEPADHETKSYQRRGPGRPVWWNGPSFSRAIENVDYEASGGLRMMYR